MTRGEFCEKLLECRKLSGVKMKDICFAMNVMPTAIYRMESGKNNFSIDHVLTYVRSIGYGVYICKNDTKDFLFDNREHFSNKLKAYRKELKMSLRDFAASAGVSLSVVRGIEDGNKNTAIDSILLCIDKLNCKLEIRKI